MFKRRSLNGHSTATLNGHPVTHLLDLRPTLLRFPSAAQTKERGCEDEEGERGDGRDHHPPPHPDDDDVFFDLAKNCIYRHEQISALHEEERRLWAEAGAGQRPRISDAGAGYLPLLFITSERAGVSAE